MTRPNNRPLLVIGAIAVALIVVVATIAFVRLGIESEVGEGSAPSASQPVAESAETTSAQSAEREVQSAPVSPPELSSGRGEAPASPPLLIAPVPESTAQSGIARVRPASTSPPSTSQPTATTFVGGARNRAVSASADRISTFSLDTDRTSYQLALNWVKNGFAVDPDSVRAEEWVNAFDYQYAEPLREDSFAISSALMPHPLDAQKHLARIGFKAPALVDNTPLNVTLVLDASGSMQENNRVEIARQAANSLIGSLSPQDRVAIVQFSTDVVHDLTVVHTIPRDPSIEYSIYALTPREQTNVQAGIDLGMQIADRARRARPDAYNYVILMSDGVANVDATDPFAILESSGEPVSANPIRLITIGVGIDNFNDQLLEQLAQYGNGWYRYLSDTSQARNTFGRANWLAISVPFADQTRAQVTWNENIVNTWRLIGYENRVKSDESFLENRREFAEIPAGAATTVFYELELNDHPNLRQLTLGEVELRWTTPVSGDSNRQHAMITSQMNTTFGPEELALFGFGAVVALASDRYSALSSPEHDQYAVGSDLNALQAEFQSLNGVLGGLAAFADFELLLSHLASIPVEGDGPPTGYSP